MKNMKLALAISVATILAGVAPANAAITVQSTNFIASPSFFNGFEGIESDPNYTAPFYFSGTKTYSEGGIDISYVGGSSSATEIWTKYQFVGTNGWYNDGGGEGYTKVKLTGGGAFDALQFLAGTGFGSSTTYYSALLNGNVVSQGTIGAVSGGDGSNLRYYGLSGGGFDEVRLQSHTSGAFGATTYEAGAFDSFAATGAGAVPEPATWAMMIGGFGMVGGTMRYRRRKTIVSFA